jgi:TrmH family RNA methyltransferase
MRVLSAPRAAARAVQSIRVPIRLKIAGEMDPCDIRIVLVTPSHPGNIGAAARAMKNMALESLVLVNPRQFPHPEAQARASGADDVLAAARVVPSLTAALEDCGYIAATTARNRDQYFRVIDVREAAARLVTEARRAPAAVVFGSERSGLSNEELESAHALIRIPASSAYAALNLAMAVQLVAYEIFRARGAPSPLSAPPAAPLAGAQELERLYGHLAAVLEEIDFRDRTQSGTHLMARIRRLLQRAELDQNEVNILRGVLTAVQNRRRAAGGAR